MKGKVTLHDEQKLIDLGGGVTRRILAYDENLMSVEVSFETGAVGAVHTHPHTQCSYVLSGKFSYSVEGESVELNPGDSIVVPSGLPHGTICLEKGTLLDIFTPSRQDFRNQSLNNSSTGNKRN
ncbi:MAG: cupin domain-containing protein [Clostridia bacterium]|nr:cupin domain-containing protein [Clostridia bacterium]